MRILGISGSLRRGSHNRTLLRAASGGAADRSGPRRMGRACRPARIQRRPGEDASAIGARLSGFVADADALLIATPEYNASVPGALKNALDWASRPFPENVLNQKPSR